MFPPVTAEVVEIEVTPAVVTVTGAATITIPYRLRAGTDTVLPNLLTKSVPVVVFLPLLVTPCAETEQVRIALNNINNRDRI